MPEYIAKGRCCDNGNFGDGHHCQKQPSAPDAGQPSPEQFWHDRFWQPTPGTAQIVADLMTDYAAAVSEHERKAQAAKRLTIVLDDNCLATIKRLSANGGEEILFGGVMGGVKLKWQQLAAPSAPASAAREWLLQTGEDWTEILSTLGEETCDAIIEYMEGFAAEQTRQLREERKRIAKAAWQVLGTLFGIHAKGMYRICNWFWDAATLDEVPAESELFPLRDEEKNAGAKP